MKKAYPVKILIAWGEAISGNKPILEWLLQSEYKELGIFCYALHNKDDARKWLMDNGHQQLLATINAAEGNKQALMWLRKFNFDVLEKVALVADNEDGEMAWLMERGYKEMAGIAKKIQFVKNQIEMDNNDVHRISRD